MNTYYISNNNYFSFLGIAYAFIGVFDLLHTLSYDGVGILSNITANLPTELWIIARYMEVISYLYAIIFMDKKTGKYNIFFIYSIISTFLFLVVFKFDIFPDCYIEGTGLTSFKIMSEYIISIGFFLSGIILVFKRKHLPSNVFRHILYAIVAKVISELAFTLYISIYEISNMVGHIFKLVSFYFLYKGIAEINLKKPYKLLNDTNIQLKLKTFQLERSYDELRLENKQRIEAEKVLKESEEKFRNLFHNVNDMIVVHKITDDGQLGKFLEVNDVLSEA